MTKQESEDQGYQEVNGHSFPIDRPLIGKLWRDLEITSGLISGLAGLASLRDSQQINTELAGGVIGFIIQPVFDIYMLQAAAASLGIFSLLEIGRRRFHL